MSTFDIVLNLANHLLPIVLTLLAFGIIISLMVGSPYCRYVSLVADADTDKGKENLARYLAQKTGGRKIDVNQSWRSFIPAARELHKKHVSKKTNP